MAANDLIDELTEKICIITGDQSLPEYQELLFYESMGRYKISRHTFGLSEDHKVNNDLSRMVKPLINKMKELHYTPS